MTLSAPLNKEVMLNHIDVIATDLPIHAEKMLKI